MDDFGKAKVSRRELMAGTAATRRPNLCPADCPGTTCRKRSVFRARATCYARSFTIDEWHAAGAKR